MLCTTQKQIAFRLRKPAVFVALALTNAAGIAQAQSQADEIPGTSLTEVIEVTAQKRAQSVMDVPLAVDAIGAEAVKERGAVLLGEIADFTPGFSFSKNDVVQSTATMRGISSSNISVGGDSSVAIFFDDFYLPRAAQSIAFSDLQRIEVLKGPQGTLFGKNAAAGVVSIYPNAPTDETEAMASMRLGNYGLKRFEGMANLVVSDAFFVRINAITNQRDPFVENHYADYNGEPLGNRDHQAARVAAVWQPDSDTRVQLAYDWDNLDQGYAAQLGVSAFAYSMNPGTRDMASDVENGHEKRDMTAVTFKLEHEFNSEWSVKLLSGYRQWEVSGKDDTDGTADSTRYVDTVNYEDSDIFYNEIQANYTGDNFSLVTGMTYSKEDVRQLTTVSLNADTVTRLISGELSATLVDALTAYGYDEATIAALGLPVDHIWDADQWASVLSVMAGVDESVAGLLTQLGTSPFAPELPAIITGTGDMTYDLIAQGLGESALVGPGLRGEFWGEDVANTGSFTSVGLYGDADFQITPQWGLNVGLRYSKDDKDFSWAITENTLAGRSLPSMINALFPLISELESSHSWSKITGRVVSRYAFSQAQMGYVSYSTGYKAGGFDSLDPLTAADPFAPEDITNIEVGYKGDLFDDMLRIQASVYSMTVDNRQLSIFSQLPGSAGLVPVIINGDQDINGFEMLVNWQPVDTVRLSAITEFRDIDSQWEPYYDYLGNLITESQQAQSATTYTLSADWLPDIDIFNGYTKVHVDYVFEENIARDDIDLLPVAYDIPGFFNDKKVLNARLSWADADEQWELAIWGNNLLDNIHFYELGGFAAEILGTPTVRVNDPRTFGVDVRYRY